MNDYVQKMSSWLISIDMDRIIIYDIEIITQEATLNDQHGETRMGGIIDTSRSLSISSICAHIWYNFWATQEKQLTSASADDFTVYD